MENFGDITDLEEKNSWRHIEICQRNKNHNDKGYFEHRNSRHKPSLENMITVNQYFHRRRYREVKDLGARLKQMKNHI